MPSTFGWLFDVYPSGGGMTVWLIDEQGRSHALRDTFAPSFYAHGPREELRAVCQMLRARHAPVTLRRTERLDLFLDRPLEVLEVSVRIPSMLTRLFRQTAEYRPDLTYYDADIPLPQRYALARDVFPLAYCHVDHREGVIERIEALDSPWEIDYKLPPLRVMTMRMTGEMRDPGRGHRGDLLVEIEGRTLCLPRARGRQLLLTTRHLLELYDPDVLISTYGDNYILPRLLQLSQHYAIPLPQRYVLARGIFPLAYCHVDHRDGRIERIEALDSPWEIDYKLPPLRVMTMRMTGEMRDPGRGHRGDLLVEIEGRTLCLPRTRGRQLLLTMRHLLELYDPDVLISTYGDNYILPRMLQLSQHYAIPLPLNRDRARQVQQKPATSYFSYGRVVFRNEQHLLFGRWHLDCQNAFLANDYGMDGILEIARLTGLPAQTTARVSTGTGISAMQVATALRRGVMVPWQKRHPEALKTGLDLLLADKGGLVYTPIAGLHEHVAELDFSAMYPSIMVHFNISPETVGATCCAGEPVPELGTPVCRHRRGLVPDTLAPLLEKRHRYKTLIGELPENDPRKEAYRRRYSAHKWLLVTCFGYLGYKNARFGRIEAHEAVNAYGREILLRTKELVEARGFRVLHMYVDGLWIHKPGARSRPDYESLLDEIRAETGLQIGLEGIYRWLAFLPSRTEPRVTVANRYFGAFEDGSLKIRGIEARRRDTPPFIKQTQLEMLNILAQGHDAAGFRAVVPQAVAYAGERLRALRTGQVPVRELVVTHRLSRQPEEYVVRTAAARAARQLGEKGVSLSPGERLPFLLVPGPEKVRAWELVEGELPYDREAYTQLFLRAAESVLVPVGVNQRALETWLLGDAGYWGPPGTLPPPGADIETPLLERVQDPGIRDQGSGIRIGPQHSFPYPQSLIPVPYPLSTS